MPASRPRRYSGSEFKPARSPVVAPVLLVSPQSSGVCCGNRRGRRAVFAVPPCPLVAAHRAEVYTFIFVNFMASARQAAFCKHRGSSRGSAGPSVIVWRLVGNPSRYFYEAMASLSHLPSVGTANVEEVGYAGTTLKLAVWKKERPIDHVLIIDFGSRYPADRAPGRETGFIAKFIHSTGPGNLLPISIRGRSYCPVACVGSRHRYAAGAWTRFDRAYPYWYLLWPADHGRAARRAADIRSPRVRPRDGSVTETCAIFDGIWHAGAEEQVWMSHGTPWTSYRRVSGLLGSAKARPMPR